MANPLKFYRDKITPYPQYVLTLAILDCQVMVLQNTSSQPKVGFEIDAKMTQKREFIEACKVNWDVYQPLSNANKTFAEGDVDDQKWFVLNLLLHSKHPANPGTSDEK